MSTPNTISAVERAMDVLTLFASSDEPTLGVTEIATELDLSKAVVFRILASLREKGFVDSDDESRRYRLGAAALRLGLSYLERVDLRSVARPWLEELRTQTDETATLSIRNGDHRIYVDQVVPDRDVKMTVQLGRSVPLHAGASSKAMLAFLDADEIDDYLESTLEKLTDATVVAPSTLRKELRVIRERGYAVSFGERLQGAGSVAAPVFDHHGDVAGVVSVSGPLDRFRREVDQIWPAVLKATNAISIQLGFKGRE